MPSSAADPTITEVALDRGALCISIDLEALWGTWDHLSDRAAARCAAHERPAVRRLLAVLERYAIPATWAVVGRLLDRGPGFDGLLGAPECWHAPDLVDEIRKSGVGHEIGSHSYGHVYFHQISSSDAREDLARASATHRRLGLPFDSFVFPRNGVAQLQELRSAGIRVFRSIDQGLLKTVGSRWPRLRPVMNLADKMLGLPSALVRPLVHHQLGLVELPSSTLLLGRDGFRRFVHPAIMRRKLRVAMRRAATEKKIFHLWFHPSNFYADADTQFAILGDALAEAARLRDAGTLAVRTMGEFAASAPAA